jgi:hypothetical protein
MDAAAMQFQQHGCGIHAVGPGRRGEIIGHASARWAQAHQMRGELVILAPFRYVIMSGTLRFR